MPGLYPYINPVLPSIAAEVLGDDASASDRSARRIAAVIGRMVSEGRIAEGARLPTVRGMARALGVSPTTVSEAWRILGAVGAIRTAGRNGTVARRPTGPSTPARYRRVTEGPGHFALDLSTGTPDPALLPELGPVLARVSSRLSTTNYLDHPVLPELEEQLAATWPFPPQAITVVNGAMDAFDRTCREILHIGDRVVVEHPTFPPLLDLLDLFECEVIGVPLDDEGMSLDALTDAAALHPRAVIIQPRAQNPTGVAMSARRAAEIAATFTPADPEHSAPVPWFLEDDHAAAISAAPLVSIGTHLPERTVHVRSFSKSHGPDLRLAAIGGNADVVTAIENRRLLGPGWSSRVLQAVLCELLTDEATQDLLRVAAETYAHRQVVVQAALGRHGLRGRPGDGINSWIEVADEHAALVELAAHGIGVAPGRPFVVLPDSTHHMRATVGLITGSDAEITAVANQLATAATRSGLRHRHR